MSSALCAGCAFDTSEQVPGTPAVGDNWHFTNYTGWADPDPMASGLEARLIEAEALLQAGNAAVWLAALNQLRTDYDVYQPVTRGAVAASLANKKRSSLNTDSRVNRLCDGPDRTVENRWTTHAWLEHGRMLVFMH